MSADFTGLGPVRECAWLDARLPPRFWRKVEVNPDSGCWEWRAALISTGYGHFLFEGKMWLIHRLTVSLREPLVKGMVIDHLCRNPLCCNPSHLEQVTQKVNMERAVFRPVVRPAKTHCVNGHELSPENRLSRPGRVRGECKTCHRERMRRKLA